MGGAIAVHVAAKLSIPSLIGLAVIDVVEGKKEQFHIHTDHSVVFPMVLSTIIIIMCVYTAGTAMDSLAVGANQSFLSNRPSSFKSLQHAIEWRSVLDSSIQKNSL